MCLFGMSCEMEFGSEGQVNSLEKRFTSKNWGMEGTCHSCHIYEIWSSKDVGEM